MKTRAAIYLIATLSILLLAAACAKAPDDGQLTSRIQARMNEGSGLSGKAITVQTAGGVVTLGGTVDNDNQRMAASRYAAAIPGVKEVVNNLQVAAPAAPQALQAPAQEQPKAAPKPKPAARAQSKPSPAVAAKKEPAPDPTEEERQAPAHVEPAMQSAPPAPAVPPTPPPPQKVTIPAGTTLAIRLVDGLNSETAQPGQTFRATLDSPLSAEGEIAIPHGYDVQGHVVDVKSAGKFAGKSELVLQLDRISVGGKSYSIQTDQYRRAGSSRTTNTAEKVGAGAAIGAIIGGIAGGGKGAAIGAAAGGGLGGGVQAATKGQQINLPAEAVLNFTLQSPLTVTPVSEGPNPIRQKLETPQ